MFASYVPATVSNATIVSIDPSEALKMPGVVDFISAADLGPAIASMAVYLLMAVVLVLKPSGLFPARA